MNLNLLLPLRDVLAHPLTERLGWTLAHSVWQFLLIALVLAGVLALLHRRSANARYVAACAALGLCAVMMLVTFALLPQTEQHSFAAARDDSHTTTLRSLSFDAVLLEPAPAAAPMTAMQRLESLLPWMVIAWAMGVGALSIWNGVGWLRVQRLRRMARPMVDQPWAELLARLCSRLRVRRTVRLALSERVDVPSVIGCFKAIILVPPSALSGLPPQQLEALLAHELAHVRRWDYLINLIQTVIETLLFYHPAVWWMSRLIRQEREHCCDDLAAQVCGDRRRYAHALARMEELRIGSPASLALGAGGGALLPRIRRLLGLPAPATRGVGSLPATLVGIVCVLVPLLVGPLQARQSDAPTNQTPTTESADQAVKPGERLTIAITDLVGPGVESTYNARVSDQGKIALEEPMGVIDVRGKNPPQIEWAIAMRLRETNTVQNAQVTVHRAPPPPGEPGVDPELLEVLQKRLPEFRFQDIAFADVIEFLRETTGANIVVNWRMVESIGITRDEPVTLRLRDVTVDKALQVLLEQLSSDFGQLGYIADQNVISISVAEAAPVFKGTAVIAGPQSEPAPAPAAPAPSRREGVYYISGVERAGTYAVTAGQIMLHQALIAAGGKEITGKHVILIGQDPRTGERRRLVFSIDELLEKRTQITVEPNDVLIVTANPAATQPVFREKFRIEGAVPRAGEYGLDRQRPLTLLQALIAAGADPAAQVDMWVTVYDQNDLRHYRAKMAQLIGSTETLAVQQNYRIVVEEKPEPE